MVVSKAGSARATSASILNPFNSGFHRYFSVEFIHHLASEFYKSLFIFVMCLEGVKDLSRTTLGEMKYGHVSMHSMCRHLPTYPTVVQPGSLC